jgi:hypothetical protein
MRLRRRSLLLVAGVLYLLATVVWLGAERRSPRQFLSPGSALNDGERGTSLAREYLHARPGHPPVGLLERPVSTAELPRDAVVFRLEPEWLPWQPAWREAPEPKKPKKIAAQGKKGKKEKKAATDDAGETPGEVPAAKHSDHFAPLLTDEEEEWVRGGGRLVLGVSGEYGPVWVEWEWSGPPQPILKVFPLWPEVPKLRLLDRYGLRGPALGRAYAIFLAGENPVVARLPLGRGDVVLLSCPDVFHNARLAVGGHLALLGALAGDPAGRPVYFDELTHGIGASTGLLAQLARWGLGPALLLAGLAALGLVVRQKVRIGPPERDPPDVRSEAVDLVDSLGELYDRALSRGDALRLYWEGFVHTVAVDTGLAGPALVARARELAGGFVLPAGDLSREGFEQALATLNSARRRARDGKRDRSRGDG